VNTVFRCFRSAASERTWLDHARRCLVEPLERRRLLSSIVLPLASVSGSTVTINFDSAGDTIALSSDGAGFTVTCPAESQSLSFPGVTTAQVNGGPVDDSDRDVLDVTGLSGKSIPLTIATGRVRLLASASGSNATTPIVLAQLSLSTGASAILAPQPLADGPFVLVLGGLSISNEATFDLGDSDLIVHNGDVSKITGQIKSGYAGGLWNGSTGIISSAALADTNATRSLGVLANDNGLGDALIASFDGQPAIASDVLVKYTRSGDTNLDGRVDDADYSMIDNGFNDRSAGWVNGDINYDGVIDGADYALMDNAFNAPTSTTTSTAHFSTSDGHVYLLGGFTAGQYQGHNDQGQTGFGRLDTVVVGSSANFQAFIVPGALVSITVDDVEHTFDHSSTGFQFVPLFDGLSDGPHHVIISCATSGQLFFDSDNTLQVSGASPALMSPGFAGPQGHAQFLPVLQAPFSNHAALDGSPQLLPAYGAIWSPAATGVGTGAGVRFSAAVTDISYWTNNNSDNLSRFVVYRDGVQIAGPTDPIAQQPAGVWNVQPIATGLDATTSHEYEIIPIDPGGYVQLGGVILGGGTGLDTSVVEPARPSWAFVGDTITNGTASLTTDNLRGDVRQTDAWMLTRMNGVSPIIIGTAGASMHAFAVNNPQQITALNPAPDIVFVRFGVDDLFQNVPVATFQTDYATYLNELLAGLPVTTKIFAEGVLPLSAFPPGTIAAYNQAMQTAVDATLNARVRYVDTAGWYDPAVDTNSQGTPDGVHPSATGYLKMLNREIPLVSPSGSSYTVNGPSAGSVGQASAPFTVTLAAGAVFTGDETITISDGGAGGSFLASTGDTGVSALTITPPAGTSTFSFTYAPASAPASLLLTFTDGQFGWTDPDEISFTTT
jgi:lysophospholipase L1-like esterase